MEKSVCMPCSVSLRNNLELVEYFIEWHHTCLPKKINITKNPVIVKIEKTPLLVFQNLSARIL